MADNDLTRARLGYEIALRSAILEALARLGAEALSINFQFPTPDRVIVKLETTFNERSALTVYRHTVGDMVDK